MSARGAICGVMVVTLLVACADEGGSTATTDATARPTTTTTATITSGQASSTSTAPATSPPVTTVAGVFDDVATLAGELSAVEAGLREAGVSAGDLALLGRRQQLAYRAVNRHPEWHAELLATVEPAAQGPLTHHLAARQAQVDHAAGRPPADPVTELPAWTIVEPLPVDELRGYYDEAEAATGVPWEYLAAIHFQETRMGRIVGVSSAGAVGPMQFLPSTWAGCCEGDPTVARDAIMGAARYLVLRGAPGDMAAALNGYNPNAGYVGAVTAYAANLMADERAYLGYHGWDVLFGTSEGTVRLPVGYSFTAPIEVTAYLRDHPDDLLPDT